jgi:hypothetical protein
MSTLKVSTTKQGQDVRVALDGCMDENCVLPIFKDEIQGKLIIDLEKLTMVNSLGSRRWQKWIKDVRAQGGISLVRCSTPFVAQVNVLQGFVPPAVKIESFLVPYLCTKCAHEEHLLFTVGKDTSVTDERICPTCGGTSKLDVHKSHYFNFLDKKSA